MWSGGHDVGMGRKSGQVRGEVGTDRVLVVDGREGGEESLEGRAVELRRL